MPNRHMTGLLVGLVSGATMSVAHAADTATLQGHVLSSADTRPLAGARIQIRETGTSNTTSSDGAFSFTRLAAGQDKLVITSTRSATVQRTLDGRAKDTT